MRPKLEFLDKPLIERILEEAFQLIEDPGVRVAPYVEDLLRAAGITVKEGVAHIPEVLARRLLDLVPRGFCLYDRLGKPAVHYSGDTVHFDPGSSCLNILDPETQQSRPAMSADLVRLVQVAEMLPQFAAQSTAMVCNDIPPEIGDLACHSIEKLVIDAEAIASAQRLIEGIQPRGLSLAVDMFTQTGLQGDFLKLRETRELFRKEQHFPSAVIDRGLPLADGTSPDIPQRARHRVDELVAAYERHPLADDVEQELTALAQREARSSGLDGLPGILTPEFAHEPNLKK